MDIWIQFGVLVLASYTVGSIPLSFLVAKARGVDLRKQGSQQVGGGNLWRTTSRKLGVLIGIFDFIKGALMAFITWRLGLDAGMQLGVGLAAVAGHNWSAFLHFYGGRGIATALGIIIILPWINRGEITTWPLVTFFSVGVALLFIFRRTPVPILMGIIMLPVMSAIQQEPLSVILGYTAMVVIIIIKRLIAQPSTEKRQISLGHLILNRFFFDRDVRYRADWVHRKHRDKRG